jgi:hypothetical protein
LGGDKERRRDGTKEAEEANGRHVDEEHDDKVSEEATRIQVQAHHEVSTDFKE